MARPFLDILGSILGLLFGLTVAFSGYRMAKGLAGLAGFLVGVVVGLIVGFPFGGPIGSLVGALVVGILFALLFQFAFRLVGGALGGVGAYALTAALGWHIWAIAFAVLTGVIIGLAINKVMIVAATALLGAWLAIRSAFELMGDVGATLPAQRPLFELVATLAVAALAATAQWRAVRHED